MNWTVWTRVGALRSRRFWLVPLCLSGLGAARPAVAGTVDAAFGGLALAPAADLIPADAPASDACRELWTSLAALDLRSASATPPRLPRPAACRPPATLRARQADYVATCAPWMRPSGPGGRRPDECAQAVLGYRLGAIRWISKERGDDLATLTEPRVLVARFAAAEAFSEGVPARLRLQELGAVPADLEFMAVGTTYATIQPAASPESVAAAETVLAQAHAALPTNLVVSECLRTPIA